MELELKYLAPYLPYGLKIYQEDLREHVNTFSWELNIETNLKQVLEFQNKPILRPLSDLTEEYVSRKTIDDYNFCSSRDITKCLSYHSLSYLLSLHFDVFGLIEKGLAIDINTLKQ